GPVGVVRETGAVLTLADLREANRAAFALAGLGFPPVLQPGRPQAARLLRNARGQTRFGEPRRGLEVFSPPQPLQVDACPRGLREMFSGDAVGLFGGALGECGPDLVK